jgi:MFS family permease
MPAFPATVETGLRARLLRAAGGPVRARVIVLLACVLALDTADVSMLGAVATKLEPALRLSNTEFGILVALPSLVAAIATVPMGVLTDRTCRTRLLEVTVALWGVAMAIGAASGSFTMLLVSRVALGAATATAGPTISSLIGDYFPVHERGSVYGMILSGELLGAGVGFIIAGEAASIASWRTAFLALAVPSLALSVLVWRKLPEPARGGVSRLVAGATEFVDLAQTATADAIEEPELSLAQETIEKREVRPHEAMILRGDPTKMRLWEATRYVLRVRTNLILIVASSLGYFYLTGLETFGLVYIRHHYGMSQATGTLLLGGLGLGALVGVFCGGRLADRALGHGNVNARIMVGGYSFVIAAALLVPALLGRQIAWTLPLLAVASAFFAARDPALDAARLDVMHHRLWGRAEGVRTFLRRLVVATAPVAFGALADSLHGGSAAGGQRGFGAGASAAGLHLTFLILTATLALGGILTFRARRTYPRDVATAVASEAATAAAAGRDEAAEPDARSQIRRAEPFPRDRGSIRAST